MLKKPKAAVQFNIPEEQCNELKAPDKTLKSILQSGTRCPVTKVQQVTEEQRGKEENERPQELSFVCEVF